MELNNLKRRQDRPFYRKYTIEIIDGKRVNKLVSWSQRRCKVCGRYIGGAKQFLCERCYKKRHAEQIKINHMENRNQVQYYSLKTIRELIEMPLPLYLRNSLRTYT